jgi:hypothetical protein
MVGQFRSAPGLASNLRRFIEQGLGFVHYAYAATADANEALNHRG